MTRAIVVWLPDWPITAFRRTISHETGEAGPIATVHANRVVACSAAARREGVRRGQRRRDAQASCAALRIVAADAGRDERAFLPVLSALDALAPGVQMLRAGLAAVRARGPARFYGGEQSAAHVLLGELSSLGLPGARIGVADGVFTADRAARLTSDESPVRIVPDGGSAEFLAPLPIAAIDDEHLVLLLVRLGVRTLGGFAGLDVEQVRARLGEHGARLHALAGGADSRRVDPMTPPPELSRQIAFEPPLELAEQVAFAVRMTADEVCTALGEANLVCTEMRITLADDRGERSERVWLHPSRFDAAALVDRVRWQLQSDEGSGLSGGVALVRFDPEAVDDGAHHQPALLGQGPDERLHHALSRVQAMLGHRGVLSPVLGGGRMLDEREMRVAWGDGERPALRRELPWPGSLPSPLPAEVFREPRPVRIAGAGGASVAVDERGALSAAPAVIDGRDIVAWAGPWPVFERGWDERRSRRAHRFQVVDHAQTAWLVVLEDGVWTAEGRYS